MAQYTQICSDCGSTEVVIYGQRLIAGELCWSGRATCESCGSIAEFDGRGELPEDLRPAILAEEGEWQLVLDDRKDTVRALRVIRERLQVPLQESKALLNDLRGTKTKLAWIQDGLRQENISSTLILCR
ncbi:hypothetical protein FYZ48_24475 [Gimesia chilikensis]|uniref:hypothetical protein n=1 Tax=Gimesia chilikensis TaxID=2605989 RepID=UPI0011EF69F0|nr:hypothetical protein [Gimesia chilikensis]KAA0133003.1 hypothetical protein FYZ48_24475 [Gimesia chilikensis]